MDDLGEKISALKTKIAAEGEKDKKLRADFNEAMIIVFCDKKIPTFVGDFYLKNNRLFLKAKNKTMANELFLRTRQILENLKTNHPEIKEIIVR